MVLLRHLNPGRVLLLLPTLSKYHSRSLATKRLTPSLTFMTNSPSVKELRVAKDSPLRLEYSSEGRPLSILVCWLMAKNKPVNKYAKLYLDQGFDVLTVRISPWQLLWPRAAAPIIQNEILGYLHGSDHQKKLLHGFSVGGYVFAQMLRYMEEEETKYKALRDSFVGQIWDSVVDINGTAIGVSKSVFPDSKALQVSLHRLIDFYMFLMYPLATKYYYQSHEYFYYHPLKTPALFFCSQSDQISTPDVVKALQIEWGKAGIPVTTREWPNTIHVSHYYKHPEEYVRTLYQFMDDVKILPRTRSNTFIAEEVDEEVSKIGQRMSVASEADVKPNFDLKTST